MIATNRRFTVKELQASCKIKVKYNSIKKIEITIDDRLFFNKHVRELVKRISMSTGLFYIVSTLLSLKVKLNANNVLIYSRLSYAITIWRKTLLVIGIFVLTT